MARALSPEKRRLILQSALRAIAERGLAASTSAIAKGAGLAEGTIFTYFPSKEALFNDLYVELKTGVSARLQRGFPVGASLRERARHVWMEYLHWANERPEERKVALLLQLSTVVSDLNRARMTAELEIVTETMAELSKQGAFLSLPPKFAGTAMKSMQEAVLETPVRSRRERTHLFEESFEAFWRMVQ